MCRFINHQYGLLISNTPMSEGILPAVCVVLVIWEAFHDELVDLRDGQHSLWRVVDGHGGQGNVRVGRLRVPVHLPVGRPRHLHQTAATAKLSKTWVAGRRRKQWRRFTNWRRRVEGGGGGRSLAGKSGCTLHQPWCTFFLHVYLNAWKSTFINEKSTFDSSVQTGAKGQEQKENNFCRQKKHQKESMLLLKIMLGL